MHISEIVMEYYVDILLGLTFTAISMLWVRIWALHNGMKALLRNHIVSAYNKCLDKGFVPLHERDNIQNMYENYKKLGGNGNVTKIVEDILDMPCREVIVNIKDQSGQSKET